MISTGQFVTLAVFFLYISSLCMFYCIPVPSFLFPKGRFSHLPESVFLFPILLLSVMVVAKYNDHYVLPRYILQRSSSFLFPKGRFSHLPESVFLFPILLLSVMVVAKYNDHYVLPRYILQRSSAPLDSRLTNPCNDS